MKFTALLIFILVSFVICNGYANGERMKTDVEKVRIYDAASNSYQVVDKIVKTDAEWKKILTEEQYNITRGHGTEAAFCSLPTKAHGKGLYKCVCCGTDLFKVTEKFESG